jgi:hypothetical protein
VNEDAEFRRFTAEQAGLGFHMPIVVTKMPTAGPNSPVDGEAGVTADINSQHIDLLVKLPPARKTTKL